MAEHSVGLMSSIVLALFVFVITMVFTALAGAGIYPFLQSTGNISDEYRTEITPAGWTFTIWSIIYTFLALVLVYALSGFCRKNVYGYVYCSPAVLPRGFFIALSLNLGLNVGWLFLWDRSLMIPALVFLVFIAVTNFIVIAFSCVGLHSYGPWLHKYHRPDLWLTRILVQNGIAVYATWTTIASLLNLNIVLVTEANMSHSAASTTALSILAAVLLLWFRVENFLLEKHVRYILTVYPTVIWALTGVFTKNYDTAAPTRNNIFIVALLGTACSLLVARVLLVSWRTVTRPLYADVDPQDLTPMELSRRQRSIFK